MNKPILRLTYDDYEDHNLANLVLDVAHGNVEDLNLYAYKKIISKITGWPLGNRPQDKEEKLTSVIAKKAVNPEKVLIFSPHPDDDVISMGGTIKKLHEQGHEVHVAYMTSGSNAVFDYDAKKYLLFFRDLSDQYLRWQGMNKEGNTQFYDDLVKNIDLNLKKLESVN